MAHHFQHNTRRSHRHHGVATRAIKLRGDVELKPAPYFRSTHHVTQTTCPGVPYEKPVSVRGSDRKPLLALIQCLQPRVPVSLAIELKPRSGACRRQTEFRATNGAQPIPRFFLVDGSVLAVGALCARLASPPLLAQKTDGRAVYGDSVRVHDLQSPRAIVGRTDGAEVLVPSPVRQRERRAVDHDKAEVFTTASPSRREGHCLLNSLGSYAGVVQKVIGALTSGACLAYLQDFPRRMFAASAASCTSRLVRRESPSSAWPNTSSAQSFALSSFMHDQTQGEPLKFPTNPEIRSMVRQNWGIFTRQMQHAIVM